MGFGSVTLKFLARSSGLLPIQIATRFRMSTVDVVAHDEIIPACVLLKRSRPSPCPTGRPAHPGGIAMAPHQETCDGKYCAPALEEGIEDLRSLLVPAHSADGESGGVSTACPLGTPSFIPRRMAGKRSEGVAPGSFGTEARHYRRRSLMERGPGRQSGPFALVIRK